MAEFYDDFYLKRREDYHTYTKGPGEWVKRESIFEREQLCRLFAEHEGEDYSDILKIDKGWWTFYHLSEMRRGLFSWYEFKENAVLLEVDADFGALTGELCDRCAWVTATESSLKKARAIADRYRDRKNLEVFAGAIEDFDYTKFYGRYDYIVLYDVLERKGYGYKEKKAYLEYLNFMKSLLRKGGKILLVTTNRYGVRYLCGARDRFTGKPFDGMNRYPGGTEAYAFEKGELQELLCDAGLENHKFFYPIPDAQVPQVICTDGNFKYEDIFDRITFYDVQDDTLVARERYLVDDFIRNNVFGYFANSYFIEASPDGGCSDIQYAIVSLDRGRERSFTTVISGSQVVQKKPVYKQGEKTLQQCARNMEAISRHGIQVVQHKMVNGCMQMPYIEENTLEVELRKAAKQDKRKFYRLLDLLYDNICRSSVYVSDDFIEEEGPVLKECYFDMVPVNCFYADDKLFFFDQEFVKYNYPAKYTLYRAIKYTYMSIWELEESIPRCNVIGRYKLNSKWEEFERTEDAFIAALRNKQVTGQIEVWSSTDEKKIFSRGEWLQKSDGGYDHA